MVICHLTKGFDPNKKPEDYDPAVTFTGSVSATLDPTDFLTSWKFRFLQFCEVVSLHFEYVGKDSADGSILIQAHTKPAMTQSFTLDSIHKFQPYTNDKFADQKGNIISSEMSDHPTIRVGPTLPNRLTSTTNYLLHSLDERKFWTVFCAEDPKGNRQHLAHFKWTLRHEVRYVWRSGSAKGTVQANSKVTAGKVELGAPKNLPNAALLANPVGPYHNALMSLVIPVAVAGKDPNNRLDSSDRNGVVPSDFWK